MKKRNANPLTAIRDAIIASDPETHRNGIAYGGRQQPRAYDPNYVGPGRPTMYNRDMANEICSRMAAGESLKRICEDDHMPNRGTVMKWVFTIDHEFTNMYRLARQAQMECWAEELRVIAEDAPSDTVEVQRARLISDNVKWSAARLLPNIYGDRIEANINQKSVVELGQHAIGQLANILVTALSKKDMVE